MYPSLRNAMGSMTLLIAIALTQHASGQASVSWVAQTVGVSIAVDSQDNVYTLNHEFNLGAEMLLTKRDSSGQLLWTSQFDQTDPTKWERSSWVVVDHEDRAIVTGTLMSGFSNPVEAASIAMKFDVDGSILWREVYENAFDGSSTRRCLIDANNNVYVLGLGTGPSGYVTKVKKFTPNGVAVWSYFDGEGIGAPVLFKLTPDNALLISARSVTGSLNGYAKIDLDGNEIWSLAGVQSLTPGDADGDSVGNTYIVHGQFGAGGGTVVKKLDGTGMLVWENVYPTTGYRIEVGTDQRPVVSGFPNQNTAGAAFFKVDQNGSLVWSNPNADGPLALLLHAQMVLDASDNAYLAAGTLFEMAVCKVASDGSTEWTQTMPGGHANAMALGNDPSSVYVVGGVTARVTQNLSTQFVRGDANGDAASNIADAVFLLGFLFGSPGTILPCEDAGDANDDGTLNIADAITQLNSLFGAGTLPPPTVCGQDPTSDALGCQSYGACP